jgi:RimJ/RimL family protein N-acetyltransferase
MEWRNEQLYHLRQNKLLTIDAQDKYFQTVIESLFVNERPDQILFSYLEDEQCIGYGGLVHINWQDSNAEISFVLNTKLEASSFEQHWIRYLGLIELVAFNDIDLYKIFTYAFDLRPRLYVCLEKSGFVKEAVLKSHSKFEERFVDVVIHSKFNLQAEKLKNERFYLREAEFADGKLLFSWVNDPVVRQNSINGGNIDWESHLKWFEAKLSNSNSKIFILVDAQSNQNIGQIRIDYDNQHWVIDYSIDKKFRNMGLGREIVSLLMQKFRDYKYYAVVRKENLSSITIFTRLGFRQVKTGNSSFTVFEKDNNE